VGKFGHKEGLSPRGNVVITYHQLCFAPIEDSLVCFSRIQQFWYSFSPAMSQLARLSLRNTENKIQIRAYTGYLFAAFQHNLGLYFLFKSSKEPFCATENRCHHWPSIFPFCPTRKVTVPPKKFFDECMVWDRTAWPRFGALDPILFNEPAPVSNPLSRHFLVRVHVNSPHPTINSLTVHPLSLGYPFIFLSDRILICMSAKNIVAPFAIDCVTFLWRSHLIEQTTVFY
jgi:hypothetical protein